MARNRFSPLVQSSVLAFVTLLLVGCDNPQISERWIGFYSFPNDDKKFPLYMDLKIEDGIVTGNALDGNMEEATVGGTVEGESYSLHLHPVKYGSNTNQDVYYRGVRSNDSIVGEWQHVVGVKGSWNANMTGLAPKEAMKPYEVACAEGKVAGRDTAEIRCEQ